MSSAGLGPNAAASWLCDTRVEMSRDKVELAKLFAGGVPHRRRGEVIGDPHVLGGDPYIEHRRDEMRYQLLVLLAEDERPPRIVSEGCANSRHHLGAIVRQCPPNHWPGAVFRTLAFTGKALGCKL